MTLRPSGANHPIPTACTLHVTAAAAAFLGGVIVGRDRSAAETCLVLAAWREDGRIRYRMRLAEAAAVTDMVRLSVQNLELAMEPGSVALLDGAEIGFTGGALSIANPNSPDDTNALTA